MIDQDPLDDADLRAGFRHLREGEAETAPPLPRLLARARARAGISRADHPVGSGRRWAAGAALAVILLLLGVAGPVLRWRGEPGTSLAGLPGLLEADRPAPSLFGGIDSPGSDSLLPFHLTVDVF